jgi:pyrroloquinoline-quinone synthase
MELKARLERVIKDWNLLDHPFYQSWRAGDLPMENLAAYAREYGSWIRLLPEGWAAVGDEATAAEEREHAMLWDSFASSLDTAVDAPETGRVEALLTRAEECFANVPSALGALYAFESQQPHTTASKLEGLRLHYDLGAAAETYFIVHEGDDHESDEILERIAALDPAEQQLAVQACETMAMHLWDALTAVTPRSMQAAV